MLTKVSATAVPTCASRKATASSETLRCRPWDNILGQYRVLTRAVDRTPSMTDRVSSTSSTKPVPRFMNQSSGPFMKLGGALV